MYLYAKLSAAICATGLGVQPRKKENSRPMTLAAGVGSMDQPSNAKIFFKDISQ